MMWIDGQFQSGITSGYYRVWTSTVFMHMPSPLALVAYEGLRTESVDI